MKRRIPTLAASALAFVLAACAGQPAAPTPSATGTTSAPDPTTAAASTLAPAPSPSGPADAGACMAKAKAMKQEQRAAQVIMVGVTPGANWGSATELIHTGVGGVFYTSGQEQSSDELAGISRQVSSGVPVSPLIATDQEGGEVQGLTGAGFDAIPSAVDQATMPADQLSASWEKWAHQLSAAGVNVDLAPVADVVPSGTARSNPPIGKINRQYGADGPAVHDAVAAVLDGMHRGGVSGTLKHFPGLGRVTTNTDFAAATDAQTTLDDPALQGFYGNLDKTGMVMVSSARYERIDSSTIAAFSPTVHRALRDHGFTGVIVSDDLGGAAAAQNYSVDQRAVLFVQAGGDLVLSVSAPAAFRMAQALESKANADPAFADLLVQHAARILTYKQNLGLTRC